MAYGLRHLTLVLALLCSLVSILPSTIEAGELTGVIREKDGSPLAGAHVYVYPSGSDNVRGPSDFMSDDTPATGEYRVILPGGSYKVVARKRMSGRTTGPIETGDLTSGNPVEIVIPDSAAVKQDFAVSPFGGRALFSDRAYRTGSSGLMGQVVDVSGHAVAGAYVFALRRADYRGAPDFVSSWTSPDGTFTLYLPPAERLYIGARVKYPGKPQADEPYGRWRDGAPVEVKEGEFVKDVRIVLKPFASHSEP